MNGDNLLPVPADAHEANGLIERANRTLRSRYDRLSACDQRAHTNVIMQEAAYAKNISRGQLGIRFQIDIWAGTTPAWGRISSSPNHRIDN